MIEPRVVLFIIIGIIGCIYSIYKGFIFLKQKQTIADTPTSKISTASIGSSVEIKGRCIPLSKDSHIVSPLLNQSCIAYMWIIEEYVKRGKSSTWKERGRFYSDHFIKIKDRSGKSVLVRFNELNFDFWRTKKRVNLKSFFSKPHPGIVKVIEKYPELGSIIRHKEFLGAFRVTEYCILPFHNIYLLGEASSETVINNSKQLGDYKSIFGDESYFEGYRDKQDDVQFSMKTSQKLGDILKIDKVFISNYREKDLMAKIALKAYLLISLGIVALSALMFFIFRYLSIIQ